MDLEIALKFEFKNVHSVLESVAWPPETRQVRAAPSAISDGQPVPSAWLNRVPAVVDRMRHPVDPERVLRPRLEVGGVETQGEVPVLIHNALPHVNLYSRALIRRAQAPIEIWPCINTVMPTAPLVILRNSPIGCVSHLDSDA